MSEPDSAHLGEQGPVIAHEVEQAAVQDGLQALLGGRPLLAPDEHVDALHVCGTQQLFHKEGSNVATRACTGSRGAQEEPLFGPGSATSLPLYRSRKPTSSAAPRLPKQAH